MSKPKRKQLFIDPTVQGVMLRRALIYWSACVLLIVLPFLIGKTLREPQKFFFEDIGELWTRVGPVLICAVLALPFLIYDIIQLTNRFAGPMFRLRREMHRLANGEPVRRIHFRDGDYWHEFATYFNQIAERIPGAVPPGAPQKTSAGQTGREDESVEAREHQPVA